MSLIVIRRFSLWIVFLIDMNWLVLSIMSALLLGIYDVAKKTSVRDNAVPAVLFASVSIAACIWLPWIVVSRIDPDLLPSPMLHVRPMTALQHAALLFKSALVATSWALAYFSLKHLPLSIAGPFRALGPVWTIVIATLFLGERPALVQWMGIAVVLLAFYGFSRAGKREGIHFSRDRAVAWMILATLIGACSGLWDKLLMQRMDLDAPTVQAWFSVDLVVVLVPLFAYWKRYDSKRVPFEWRTSIPMIAIFLLLADFAYFTALEDKDALISVISPVRRLAAAVSFIASVTMLKEKNVKPKAACLVVLLVGIFLIGLGSDLPNDPVR